MALHKSDAYSKKWNQPFHPCIIMSLILLYSPQTVKQKATLLTPHDISTLTCGVICKCCQKGEMILAKALRDPS